MVDALPYCECLQESPVSFFLCGSSPVHAFVRKEVANGLVIQAWHISEGLGVQFLESKDKFPPYPADYNNVCADWKSYYDNNPAYLKDDSGL